MLNRVLLGGLLGGVVVFVWSALSWMLLPWHFSTLGRFNDESAVARVLARNATHSGIYVLPNPRRSSTQAGAGAESSPPAKGTPLVFASVRLPGDSPDMAQAFSGSLAIQLLGAMLAAWLLSMTRGLGYLRRVLFVALTGAFAAVVGCLPYWNWWGFSAEFTAVGMFDLMIGWFFAGLAIAKLVARPE